jgi:hypothetical protein
MAKNKKIKQLSLLAKILEAVIVIGALAGVILKMLGGEKKKEK